MRKGTGLNDDVMFSTLPALSLCVCVCVCKCARRGSPKAPEDPKGPLIPPWLYSGEDQVCSNNNICL